MKHYRLDKGVPCHVRKVGTFDWMPHTTSKRLFFVEFTADGPDRVFVHEGWEIRVRADLLSGAATAPPSAAPQPTAPTPQVPEGHMVLTSENLHALASGGNGFTSEQMRILGVTWPPPKGWLKKRIGTTLPIATYEHLLSLKGMGKKKRKQMGRDATPPIFDQDAPRRSG